VAKSCRPLFLVVAIWGIALASAGPYNAVCTDPHGVSGAYTGPPRKTRTEAESDCARHKQSKTEYANHECFVVE